MKSCMDTAMKSVSFSYIILLIGQEIRIISCSTNFVVVSEVASLVIHAIGQPVMCSTAIKQDLSTAFYGLKGPSN